jgi:hypothetical protein
MNHVQSIEFYKNIWSDEHPFEYKNIKINNPKIDVKSINLYSKNYSFLIVEDLDGTLYVFLLNIDGNILIDSNENIKHILESNGQEYHENMQISSGIESKQCISLSIVPSNKKIKVDFIKYNYACFDLEKCKTLDLLMLLIFKLANKYYIEYDIYLDDNLTKDNNKVYVYIYLSMITNGIEIDNYNRISKYNKYGFVMTREINGTIPKIELKEEDKNISIEMFKNNYREQYDLIDSYWDKKFKDMKLEYRKIMTVIKTLDIQCNKMHGGYLHKKVRKTRNKRRKYKKKTKRYKK